MNDTAALPDPDHTNPEHLRWAADILEARGADSDAHNFWFTPIDRVAVTAARVRLDADRIERERAEQDATEKLYRANARALRTLFLDKQDVTNQVIGAAGEYAIKHFGGAVRVELGDLVVTIEAEKPKEADQ